MAKEQILEKIDSFLHTHNPLTEECHVVYLMVQIRKVIDHENTTEYPLLRFYCNWTVHTEKYTTPVMKEIMNEIFQAVKTQIENPIAVLSSPPVMEFAYMEKLKEEVTKFLQMRSLPLSLVEGENWIFFVALLIKILENQPIVNPNDDIEIFSFIPAAERCVRGIIKFNQNINGFDHYNFGNAY